MRSDVRALGRVGLRERSRVAIRRSGERAAGGMVDERPRSVYEVVTRQMLAELKEDVAEVKGRVNALLWLVAGAIVMELVTKAIR